jgi:adenylate kinase family enzyme
VTQVNIREYNRIVVIVSSGGGKSFLSKEIAAITGLPLIHLDVEYWRPNWEKTPKDEWIAKQPEVLSKEKWIMAGN